MTHRPRVYTTTELAAIIGCSPRFIRDEIASGELKAIRVGRGHITGSRLRIHAEEAERYMKQLGVDRPHSHTSAHLLEAFEHSPYPAVLSRNAVIMAANDKLEDLIGYTKEELLGTDGRAYVRNADTIPPVDGVKNSRVPVILIHRSGRPVLCTLVRLGGMIGRSYYHLAQFVMTLAMCCGATLPAA